MSKEHWLNEKWRPAMGWMYMVVCIADFIVFPILWSIIQAFHGGLITSQWNPLTLQGAGLFHMAMGAVLGVAAWSRGQEKIANLNTPITTPYNNPTGSNTIPYNNQPVYNPSNNIQPNPVTFKPVQTTIDDLSSPKIFTSKFGKPGPIIDDEPEL